MEHVLKFDEFIKNKCGGEKKFSMCIKVHEELVEKWEWKILLDVSRKEKKGKNTEKRHMRKKIERKIQKQRICMLWRK